MLGRIQQPEHPDIHDQTTEKTERADKQQGVDDRCRNLWEQSKYNEYDKDDRCTDLTIPLRRIPNLLILPESAIKSHEHHT